MIKGNVSYAISAASRHKDLAWEFIEWNLSRQGEDGLDNMVRGGFPSRIDVFERELKEAASESETAQGDKGGFSWDGTMVYYRETTPGEADLIRSLIESASPERSREQTILEIMGEEAVYLYDGSKSPEEVAEVTQNRVQLYLNE